MVSRAGAGCAVHAVGIPYVVVTVVASVITRVCRCGLASRVANVLIRVPVRVGILIRGLTRGPVVVKCDASCKPLVVLSAVASGRVDAVVRSTVSRVRRSQWMAPSDRSLIIPCAMSRNTAGWRQLRPFLVETLKTFVLSHLLLAPGRVVESEDIGVDSGDGRHVALTRSSSLSSLLSLLVFFPLSPTGQPSSVVGSRVQVDVKLPIHSRKPLHLQSVQFLYWNGTDLRPRLVLEGVVVKKLAPEKKSSGQHPPDLAVVELWRFTLSLGHAVDPLRHVVHSQQNCRARKSSRCEDLRHELLEGRRDGHIAERQAGGHRGNILRHHLDIVVENSTDSARHVGQIIGVGTRLKRSRYRWCQIENSSYWEHLKNKLSRLVITTCWQYSQGLQIGELTMTEEGIGMVKLVEKTSHRSLRLYLTGGQYGFPVTEISLSSSVGV